MSTLLPIAPTTAFYPPTVHPSRVPPTSQKDGLDVTGDGHAETAATATAAHTVTSKLSLPQAPATPTLPPGVSFVEEPSGIKIYVGSEQVAQNTSHT